MCKGNCRNSYHLEPGQVVRHFKGNYYRIKSIDMDSEDTSILRVSYENLKGESYSRPLDDFMARIPRFTPVPEMDWEDMVEKTREGKS